MRHRFCLEGRFCHKTAAEVAGAETEELVLVRAVSSLPPDSLGNDIFASKLLAMTQPQIGGLWDPHFAYMVRAIPSQISICKRVNNFQEVSYVSFEYQPPAALTEHLGSPKAIVRRFDRLDDRFILDIASEIVPRAAYPS
jgi:hypothetical protein